MYFAYELFTREIKDLMKDRDRLHHHFLQTRDNSDWNHYKEYRNKVKIIPRNAATTHTFNEVHKNKYNPSSLWKTINRYIPGKEKESQVYTRDQKVVANEFNQHFTSLATNAAEEVRHVAEDNNMDLISPIINGNSLFNK